MLLRAGKSVIDSTSLLMKTCTTKRFGEETMDHVLIKEHPEGGWTFDFCFDTIEDAVRASIDVLPDKPVFYAYESEGPVADEVDRVIAAVDREYRHKKERKDSLITLKRRAANAKKAYYLPPDKIRSRWQHVAEAVINTKW